MPTTIWPRRKTSFLASALALLVALGGALQPGTARAQDTEDAQKSMERGSEAMARGDFKAAVDFFRVAKRLKPDASGPLLALGLAMRANGECKSAIAELEEYKRRKANADAKAEEAIEYCKKQLAPVAPAPDLSRSSAPLERTTPIPATDVPESRPIYKAWWFWTGLAVIVAGGAVTGIVLATGGKSAPAGTGGTGPAQPAFTK